MSVKFIDSKPDGTVVVFIPSGMEGDVKDAIIRKLVRRNRKLTKQMRQLDICIDWALTKLEETTIDNTQPITA